MSIFTTQTNTFTTKSTTGEGPSPLVAGVVSFNGLVNLFGTTGINGTSETEIGLMGVSSTNEWFSRLYSTTVGANGPTGSWAGEWWSVHNYLQYGGICFVGATGSTGDYYSATGVLGITNTPIHNKSLTALDVIFEAGNTFSAGAAVNAAMARKDCVAIVGNYKKITGIPLTTTYANQQADFGVTFTTEHVIYVGGRKKFTAGVGTTVNILEANLSPDVAGCVARCARDANIWISPAGKTRGRILGVVAMQQNFSETDVSYLNAGDVNPISVFPGEGTFLMGNNTSYTGSGYLTKINGILLITYLRKQLTASTQKFLFEINEEKTRQRVIAALTPILEGVRVGNGISDYRIVCDETNNTAAIITANKLVIDVYINPYNTAETLVITIINTSTSEAYTG
jgi:hypothetical protein